jgi:hypothetical protein
MVEKYQNMPQTDRTDLLRLMLESASDEDFIQVCDNYIFLYYILNNFLFCCLKDGRAVDATNEKTDIEPPLIRKLTKHEIAANIFLFSESNVSIFLHIRFLCLQ